jgi:hypothetical protein
MTNLDKWREENPDLILTEAVGMISAVLATPGRPHSGGTEWTWDGYDGKGCTRAAPGTLLPLADIEKNSAGQIVVGYQACIGEAAIARLTEWCEENGCRIERRPDGEKQTMSQNQEPNAECMQWELSPEEKKWLEARKLAASQIDPETAEVEWTYVQILDPYGLCENIPDELWQVGRGYFARSPGSDIWVSFDDLPDEVSNKLWAKHESKLAFPAGLPLEDLAALHAELSRPDDEA